MNKGPVFSDSLYYSFVGGIVTLHGEFRHT